MSAFAALLALALAVGCRGFFPATTYTSISIEPSSPSVPLNSTQGLQLWGTDSTTNVTDQITSGAYWSIGTGSTGNATITNTGVATGTSIGAITIDATYQGLTTSASGVVYLANITSICVSLNDSSGSCAPTTESVNNGGSGTVSLFAIADYTNSSNQTLTEDITTSATWTISGPDTTDVTVSNAASPAVVSVASGATPGTYTVSVTYPQSSITGTNTVTVTAAP
jgi:hypothetical protein